MNSTMLQVTISRDLMERVKDAAARIGLRPTEATRMALVEWLDRRELPQQRSEEQYQCEAAK